MSLQRLLGLSEASGGGPPDGYIFLADDFEDGDLSPRWSVLLANATTVTEADGMLQIAVSPSTHAYNGAISPEFDFRGKYLTANVSTWHIDGAGNNLLTLIQGDNNAYMGIAPGIFSGFVCNYRYGGVDHPVNIGTLTPDRLRFRHDADADELHFESYHNIDGFWVTRHTVTPVWDLAHTQVQFVAGGGGGASATPFAIAELLSDVVIPV